MWVMISPKGEGWGEGEKDDRIPIRVFSRLVVPMRCTWCDQNTKISLTGDT